jgi:hypothetical protein
MRDQCRRRRLLTCVGALAKATREGRLATLSEVGNGSEEGDRLDCQVEDDEDDGKGTDPTAP